MPETKRVEKNIIAIGLTGKIFLDTTELADFLKLLSADYKRATRGRLAIVGFETGSAWIYVQDAVVTASVMAGQFSDILAAADRMVKFAGAVQSFFKKEKASASPNSTAQLVAKSMSRLTDLATKSGAGLELDYSFNHKSGDESISLRVTPPEVKEKQLELLRTSKAVPKAAVPRPLSSSAMMIDFNEVGSGSLSEMEALAASTVNVLVSGGNASTLPALADGLDAEGRYEFARMIRRHIPPSTERVQVQRD